MRLLWKSAPAVWLMSTRRRTMSWTGWLRLRFWNRNTVPMQHSLRNSGWKPSPQQVYLIRTLWMYMMLGKMKAFISLLWNWFRELHWRIILIWRASWISEKHWIFLFRSLPASVRPMRIELFTEISSPRILLCPVTARWRWQTSVLRRWRIRQLWRQRQQVPFIIFHRNRPGADTAMNEVIFIPLVLLCTKWWPDVCLLKGRPMWRWHWCIFRAKLHHRDSWNHPFRSALRRSFWSVPRRSRREDMRRPENWLPIWERYWLIRTASML